MEKSTLGDAYMCPSFSSYTSDRLAEIASKVAAAENSNDGDFEFSLARENHLFSAAEFGSVFPVFNRDILLNNDSTELGSSSEANRLSEQSITIPLSKLTLIENREPPSCSSSEADELESIPEGTYCVWRPNKAAAGHPSPSWWKKSKSTGSASKRWKLSDLLRRSNSEGKDSFVVLTPKNREENLSAEMAKKPKGKSGVVGRSPSAHEALYVRNRAVSEGDRRKSYLPYRRDLVGFFVNANGFGKSFPRF